MKELNADVEFTPLLAKIESGEIKTTHHLRLDLDRLSETYGVSTLNMLVTFREWLENQDIELSTNDGMVTLDKTDDEL